MRKRKHKINISMFLFTCVCVFRNDTQYRSKICTIVKHGLESLYCGSKLTITFCSHQQRSAFQSFDVSRRDVAGPTVVPLSVLIEGINFNSATSVRHPGKVAFIGPTPNLSLDCLAHVISDSKSSHNCQYVNFKLAGVNRTNSLTKQSQCRGAE